MSTKKEIIDFLNIKRFNIDYKITNEGIKLFSLKELKKIHEELAVKNLTENILKNHQVNFEENKKEKTTTISLSIYIFNEEDLKEFIDLLSNKKIENGK